MARFYYDERELADMEAIDLSEDHAGAKRKVEAKRQKLVRDKARRQVRHQAERHAKRVANRRVEPDYIPALMEF